MAITKKIQIENEIYEANVEFRNIIKCNEIANDDTIGDTERALGVAYTLFGVKALEHKEHIEKLLKWAKNYITGGKEIEQNEKPDMDYVEDMPYIKASFMSDYRIDLNKEEMEWQDFYNLINGLSNSELGNCCVLNRVRNLRNFDTKEIKDTKEREKIEKAKQMVALKKPHKVKNFTDEELKNMRDFQNLISRKE